MPNFFRLSVECGHSESNAVRLGQCLSLSFQVSPHIHQAADGAFWTTFCPQKQPDPSELRATIEDSLASLVMQPDFYRFGLAGIGVELIRPWETFRQEILEMRRTPPFVVSDATYEALGRPGDFIRAGFAWHSPRRNCPNELEILRSQS